TKAMEVFEDHTYLAETKEDYLELVEKALKDNSPEKAKARSVFAKSHTWENNVSEIYKRIVQILQSPE
ncbi:MAG TPA: hypothetical protein PLC47_00195, partial [Bacteroidales bacterium]|nr:hypothetical protein [Bacteroidales bacterium]